MCSSSGASRQTQSEAAEESEPERELVPVRSGDGRHPAVHHGSGERPAAVRLQGRFSFYSVCVQLIVCT